MVLWRVAAVSLLCATAARAVRVPPESEWAERAQHVEALRQPYVGSASNNRLSPFGFANPPRAQDAADQVRRHVPALMQLDYKRFRLRVPHEMEWDVPHFIGTVYIREASTREIVFLAELERPDARVDVELELPWRVSRNLTSYSWCNKHGLWVSETLATVDGASWNATREQLEAADIVREDCSSLVAERFLLGPDHAVSLRLLDADGAEARNGSLAAALELALSFPAGNFLGVGFGTGMLDTDMVIAAERDGVFACGDYFARSRVTGPEPDAALGGVNDVRTVSASVVDGRATVVCTRPVRSGLNSVGDTALRVGPGEAQDMVWAFGAASPNALPAPDARAHLVQHELGARGYLRAELARAGRGGVVGIGTTRDKRDLQIVHGVLMYSIWGLCVCLGAMVARYERHTTWWLGTHKILQAMATLLTLPVFFLTRAFVDEDRRYASTHAVVGYFIIYSSWVQASLGTLVYASSKVSRAVHTRLADADATAQLSPAARSALRRVSDAYGSQEFLRGLHKEKPNMTLGTAEETGAFALAGAQSLVGQRVPARWVLFVAVHVRQRFARPLHRWFGRALPVIAYSQIFLGIDRLDANPFVRDMVIGWTALVALVLVYKEVELQLRLPHGFKPKAKMLGAASVRAGNSLGRLASSSGSAAGSDDAVQSDPAAHQEPRKDVDDIIMT